MENEQLLKSVKEKAMVWLTDQYDEATRAEVKQMLDAEDPTPLIEAFYKDLEFGTGGLRGIMGAGTNRMNIYTVGAATQGLANYLGQRHQGISLRQLPPHPRAFVRNPPPRMPERREHHRLAQPQGIQRLQSLLG